MGSTDPKKADRCLEDLAAIAERYDSKVRLFFHLVNYVSLVQYDPALAKKDKSIEFRRFVSQHGLDLWEQLGQKSDTRKSSKRLQSVHAEVQKLQIDLRALKLAPAAKRRAREPFKLARAPRKMRKMSAKLVSACSATRTQPVDEVLPFAVDDDLGWPDDPVELDSAVHDKQLLITTPLNFVQPAFDGSVHNLLMSYRSVTDDQEPMADETWDKRVEMDAQIYARVATARNSGLLARVEASGIGSEEKLAKFVDVVPKSLSYFDHFVAHTLQLAKQRANLRKFHQSIVRRNTQSVDQYFRRLAGAEDREKKENERLIKQLAKRIAQEVMKKWKLAQKIVEQRRQAMLDEEKREKGKEYLNEILNKSAKLIESRAIDMGRIDHDSDSGTDEDMEDENGDRDDSELTVEQLREKYKDLPELAAGSSAEESDIHGETDSDEAQENAEDLVAHGPSGDANESAVKVDVAPEKPSDEALRLYAEIEEDSASESLSDSDSESESAETSDESDTGSSRFGLAALLGGTVESDDDEGRDADSDASETPSAYKDVVPARISETSAVELKASEHELETGAFVSVETETTTGDHEYSEVAESDSQSATEKAAAVGAQATDKNVFPDGVKVEEADDGTAYSEAASEVKAPSPVRAAELVSSRHSVEQPMLLRGTLREYQRNGLDWMAGLVMSGTNGILADEMGLGKTIQTISLMAWLASEKHIWGPHLVVVPTSVMLNWEMEFKRFLPGFKILTYFGTPQQRKRKRRGWNKEDTWHVVITSYQLVIQDQAVFRNKRWQFMVLDEAHNIKNFRSQRWQALLNFNAQFRLLLTGTPLQNNLVELWSLLYFLMPSSRATQMMPAGFASLDDFQEWFAKPVDKMVQENEEADEEARATVSKLHQVLRPYLLRRLKKDVEKQMPAKYEHVLYCRLSKRQRYLYDDFMSRASTRATLKSGNFMSILNCLMQLRKVCNHPDLFEVRPILTSLTLDRSVSHEFELVARKFYVPLLLGSGEKTLANFCFNFGEMETEPSWASPRRNELSASEALRTDILELIESLHEDEDESAETPNYENIAAWAKYDLFRRRAANVENAKHMLYLNENRLTKRPMYGRDCINYLRFTKQSQIGVCSVEQRAKLMKPVIERFACITPAVVALDLPELALGTPILEHVYDAVDPQASLVESSAFHEAQVRLSIAFPDKRLIQYDCGKLQTLAHLLQDLISKGHRCLIFTQMTRVLDILEQFLNLHGWRYLRLDGATRIEQRQALTERFNKDASVPVFILSTRSGGLGINLTGADTVIFYDSDWNPAMDRQCQDRCHRIGQTRDVHIYRLVSEYTIESNILRKATQKTLLDNVVIQEGDFTTEHFTKMSIQDIMGNDAGRGSQGITLEELRGNGAQQIEAAMAETEDKDDQLAANQALNEATLDQREFDEAEAKTPATSTADAKDPKNAPTLVSEDNVEVFEINELDERPPDEDQIGHIDDWMIMAIERGGLVEL